MGFGTRGFKAIKDLFDFLMSTWRYFRRYGATKITSILSFAMKVPHFSKISDNDNFSPIRRNSLCWIIYLCFYTNIYLCFYGNSYKNRVYPAGNT